MLIRSQHTVVLPHKIVERNDRVHLRALADQVHCAAVAEAEIARIRREEFILKRRGAVPVDAGSFAGSGYVLTDLAFLAERTVRSLLIVAGHGSRVGHVHHFVGALVGKGKRLGDLKLARLVLCLRPRGHRRRHHHGGCRQRKDCG